MQTAGTRPRRLRGLGWIAIASLLGLFVFASTGGAALAVGTTIHQAVPISWDAVAFQGDDEECAGADVAPGEVLWHFVLTQTAAASGNLTATFGSGVEQVGSSKKTGGTLHFFVTTGQTSLLNATTDVVGKNLNLSHICSGGEETTTTETTTETTTTAT